MIKESVIFVGMSLASSPANAELPWAAGESAAAVATRCDPAIPVPPVAKKINGGEVFSTGVAKGRDILDAAISTSSLRQRDIEKTGARALPEIFHNIPGIRAEVLAGETNANVTVRGLPMASSGAKFLQIQEDGLPTLEYGDVIGGAADAFLRSDLNLAGIEVIRGGSASTFASNSPGGVINLISKTGDVDGGSIIASAGVDYRQYRVDGDYGAKLSDTLRFHVGGFYRLGEGPRQTGYNAVKGGQIKFNVTKTFTGGHVRLYGKYLDDRTPNYLPAPILVGGTEANPTFRYVENFNLNRDTLLTRFHRDNLTVDDDNKPYEAAITQRALAKSIGLEGQIDLAGWTVTDRFRYSENSGAYSGNYLSVAISAPALAALLGGPGAVLSYAAGPQAGQVIANPAALNGNGLAAAIVTTSARLKSLDNIVNDLRATRVWSLGGGDLTTTAGFYKSRQTIDATFTSNSLLFDVVGKGRAAPLNLSTAGGFPLTQNGYYSYSAALFFGSVPFQAVNVDYDTNAGFGSLNYHIGRLSIGGSLRYDFGDADGRVTGAGFGDVPSLTALDINGDGVFSRPERTAGYLPAASTTPVDYDWHYLSYSTGVNFRISNPLAVFARYSRGARTNADRLLYPGVLNPSDGLLANRDALIDYVRQAEAGVKFRHNGLSLNLTGFLANATEHQIQVVTAIDRTYRTYGAEFEGSYRSGIFSLAVGATYTKGKIDRDYLAPALTGKTPAGQPKLFGFVTPSIETMRFFIGTNVYVLTDRYATNANQLKLPGYVLVSPFVQFRPAERITAMLNVNNVFNAKGISFATTGTIPTSGVIGAQAINGRTILTSARFNF